MASTFDYHYYLHRAQQGTAPMSPLLIAVGLAVFCGIQIISRFRGGRSQVNRVRGPPRGSWVLGNEHAVLTQLEVGGLEYPWFKEYGEVFRKGAFLGRDHLHVADPRAIQYILQTSGYNFAKPYDLRESVTRLFGDGIVSAAGPRHQRHRKVMNPAFSSQQLRSFMPLFQEVAVRLTRKWHTVLDTSTDGIIDLSPGLKQVALDAIGKCAFDHDFQSLNDGADELGFAMKHIFADTLFPTPAWMVYKRLWRHLPMPILNLLDLISTKETRRFRQFTGMTAEITKQLLERKEREGVMDEARDFLSVLARANHAQIGKARLDEDEILGQASTFIFAGHDTTANSLMWLMYELALHPEHQSALRAEIAATRSALGDDTPFSSAEYDSMPLLNATIKEALRLHPVAPNLFREAQRDDVIPLQTPIVDIHGEKMESIHVKKGQQFIIGINRYNMLKDVWGEDAEEWNPARFLDSKKKDVSVGVFANIMTFGTGVQSCIGWRFAIIELQTIVTQIMEEFELVVPPGGLDIVQANAGLGLTSPLLRGELEKGTQMTLKLQRVKGA